MLVEHAPAVKSHRVPAWIWIAGALFLVGVIAGAILIHYQWPFTRENLTRALEEASGRPVQIRTISNTYLPPGCVAEGIRFLHHNHPDAPPVITIEKLAIRASLTGLFRSRARLQLVKVQSLQITVPPNRPGSDKTQVLLNAGNGGKSIEISKIVADGAILTFLPENRGDKPYVLQVEKLAITNVGFGVPIFYRATLPTRNRRA